MNTVHYERFRTRRSEMIKKIGEGTALFEVILDKGHKNGLERHVITSQGIVNIYNLRTKKLITQLVARPAQIKRYYREVNKIPPEWLLDLAESHKKMGLNH